MIIKGPKPLTEEDHKRFRYTITDTIDDLRQPKSRAAQSSTASWQIIFFVHAICGAPVVRQFQEGCVSPDALFAEKFISCFDKLFAGDTGPVIHLAEEILSPFGGFLFEGYSLDAPPDFKKPFPSNT
ncbi:MAG: hypothetical protein V4654_12275 [Bdellovibrionota bacterium]